jgi:hypothetical protein
LVDSVRFAAAGTIARRSDDGTVGEGLSDGVGGADGVTVSWSPSSAIDSLRDGKLDLGVARNEPADADGWKPIDLSDRQGLQFAAVDRNLDQR